MSIMDTFKIVKTNKFGKDQSRVLTLDFNSVRGRMSSELACCSAAHCACRPALAGLEAQHERLSASWHGWVRTKRGGRFVRGRVQL